MGIFSIFEKKKETDEKVIIAEEQQANDIAVVEDTAVPAVDAEPVKEEDLSVQDKEADEPQEEVEAGENPEDETAEEERFFISFDEAVGFCEGFDRDHIWAFCSGQSSNDFIGNPKYLFTYISRYRKDIKAYWFCSSNEVILPLMCLMLPV